MERVYGVDGLLDLAEQALHFGVHKRQFPLHLFVVQDLALQLLREDRILNLQQHALVLQLHQLLLLICLLVV